MKICLLGASFDTGNLGVDALAESTIKCILNWWPGAEITFLGSGFTPKQNRLNISGREICVQMLPIRFSKNIFLPYHFLRFVLYGLLSRILPATWAKKALVGHNPYIRTLYEAELALDITGGDSFSDIYGLKRFMLGTFRKWLVLLFNKELIMLPQTYGPFKRPLTKAMARHILKRAKVIYSRDRAGIEYVNALLKNCQNGKVRFAPDVAFVLDPRRPDGQEICSLERIKTAGMTLTGLNVSGLLACCGNAEDNVFSLKADYLALINSIVEFLMERDDTAILLVPHSGVLFESDTSPRRKMRKKGYKEMSDAVACGKTYEYFSQKYGDRITLVRRHYDHNEIKYIIGLCDFFIGSRMHACIAALSQGIPAVGIAYSKKFSGVFESVGVGDCVVDARELDEKEALEKIGTILERRNQIHKHLEDVMPQVKNSVINILSLSDGNSKGDSDAEKEC